MTTQEILEKAIQKAIEGGWLEPKKPVKSVVVQTDDGNCYFQLWAGTNDMLWSETWDSVEQLIFNHDFAKALWGEKLFDELPHLRQSIPDGWTSYAPIPLWQYHLQNMVLAEDSINYLGEHL